MIKKHKMQGKKKKITKKTNPNLNAIKSTSKKWELQNTCCCKRVDEALKHFPPAANNTQAL